MFVQEYFMWLYLPYTLTLTEPLSLASSKSSYPGQPVKVPDEGRFPDLTALDSRGGSSVLQFFTGPGLEDLRGQAGFREEMMQPAG